jgi:hypothetical protein
MFLAPLNLRIHLTALLQKSSSFILRELAEPQLGLFARWGRGIGALKRLLLD